MATLVSAGVSVTVTDDSFYIPVSASTVPLIFLATKSGKTQPDGSTPATGTLEYDTVRTVTSRSQSIQLYGYPSFRKDNAGNEFHGDARNEYGLLALNQFLGVGNVAYVVRANVNLDDSSKTFLTTGTPVFGAITSNNAVGNGTITSTLASGNTIKPQTITVTFTSATNYQVAGSDLGFIGTGTMGNAFTSTPLTFTLDAGSVAFVSGDTFSFSLVAPSVTATSGATGNGKLGSLTLGTTAVAETITVTLSNATTFSVTGSVSGSLGTGTVGTAFTSAKVNFTVAAGSTPFAASDNFVIAITSVTVANQLGTNDASRRAAIVTALQAAINSNAAVRSPNYEFNLILCPGYPEVADELLALSVDIEDEALVISAPPMNKTPEQVAQWALTTDRISSTNVAYYYPHAYMSNLDGRTVLGDASGIALRTIAYSDNASYVWFAPAGTERGVVSGVSKVGYFTGTAGTATTFIETNLSKGQADLLYEFDKNINPIVYFPGRGLLVWGQKTSSATASTLDRVNAVRLVMYLRRALRKGALPYCFQPNDAITRASLKSMADGVLNRILTARGLYDYVTQCDEGNNTDDVIAANELWLNVAIAIEKAAEFIYIPITVQSGTSVEL